MTWLFLLVPILAGLGLPLNKRLYPKHPCLAAASLYGFLILYYLAQLLLLNENSISQRITVGSIQITSYIDRNTAAALLITSLVCAKTILYAPPKWGLRDGLLSLSTFTINAAALMGLLLSDSIALFALLWAVLDATGLVIHSSEYKANGTKSRWFSWVILSVSSLLLLVVPAYLFVQGHYPITFSNLIVSGESLSPTHLSLILLTLFTVVAIKTAAFPLSYFLIPASEETTSSLRQLPLVYGVISVLPGIYLLIRVHPIFTLSSVPIPLLLGASLAIGFLLFPIFYPFATDKNDN